MSIYGYCTSPKRNITGMENQVQWLKSKGVKEENIYKDIASELDKNRIEFNKKIA